MADKPQDCLFPGPCLPVSVQPLEGFRGYKAALALGVLGGGSAALFVCAHWAIAVIGAVAVLALSAVESEPFMLLIILLLPLNWIIRADFPVRDLMLVVRIVVVAGFFLGRMWRGSLRVSRLFDPSLTRASIFFAAVAVVSVILPSGGWTHESERELLRLASYLGFYFLILLSVDSAERMRDVGFLLLVSAIVISVFAALQEISGGFTSLWLYFNPPDDYFIPWRNRAPSFFAYSNTLAGYLNLLLPFALACTALGQGKWKKAGAWAVGLGCVGLLCTQSLGGLVSFCGVLVLAIFCFVRGGWKRLLLLASIWVLAFGFYIARESLNPAHTGSTLVYDASARVLMWNAAWEVFKQSPILGVGWGNFVGKYASDPTLSWISPQLLYANNLYLDLLAGVGVVGFISFSVLAFLAIRQAHHAFQSASCFLGKAFGFGALGAVVAALIHGFVDDVIVTSPQAGTLWWMMLALLVASASLETNSSTVGRASLSPVGA